MSSLSGKLSRGKPKAQLRIEGQSGCDDAICPVNTGLAHLLSMLHQSVSCTNAKGSMAGRGRVERNDAWFMENFIRTCYKLGGGRARL